MGLDTSKPLVEIVSLPIGNDGDISSRALVSLQDADILVGEESKFLSSFLKRNQIPRKFHIFNEHSTEQDLRELIAEMLTAKRIAIVSDSGLPNLEDPGRKLIPAILDGGKFRVVCIPGASSVTAGLALAGFSTRPFLFLGLLPRDREERKKEIQKFLPMNITLVILETPYRYKKLIQDLALVMGKKNKRRVFLGLHLTHPEEEFTFRGHIKDLLPLLEGLPKAPPILVVEGNEF